MSQLDPARKGKLGSSDVPALFEAHPWKTALMLYAEHTQAVGYDPEKDPDERMAWGSRLQDDIMDAVAEETGWKILPNPLNRFVEHPDPTLRTGATIDAYCEHPEWGPGLLESKNVDWKQWFEKGWDETAAPRQVEIQGQHQLWCTQHLWVQFPVLRGGNDLIRIPGPDTPRRLQEGIGPQLEAAIRTFWKRVDDREPPPPQGLACEIPALMAVYDDVIRQPPLDLRDDAEFAELLDDLEFARTRRLELEKLEQAAKVSILGKLGRYAEARAANAIVKVSKAIMPAHQRKESVQTRLNVRFFTP